MTHAPNVEIRIKIPAHYAEEITRSAPGSAAREQYVVLLGVMTFDALMAAMVTK